MVVIPCKIFIPLPIPAEQFIVVTFVISGENREGSQMEGTNQRAQVTAFSS